MRSQRGSGPDGLAGMTKLRVKSGVQLLRPLLNVSKYQLIDYLNLHGQSWVEDSSNLDMRYSRNRIRKQLLDNECEQDGIKENINTCAEQRYYMETQTACNIAAYTSIFPEGYGDLAINAWRNLPKAMAKRVLNSLAQTISGRGYPLRSEKLESLYIQMMNLPFSAATCNGCKWMIKKDKVVIHREVAYINDQCELQEGREFLWDNRYRIFGEYMPEQWHARAVGAEGLLQLDPDIKKRVRFSNAIIMTLPGIWQLEELIAVPHIGFYKTSETPRIRIRFAPSKPLAGVPFSC
jgi:tRNA(Ile)-lysidine synthase